LFTNDENKGFAHANNLSWSHARGRYWLLLNSDTEIGEGAIDSLIDFMDRTPRAGLATARLLNPDGSPQFCAQRSPSIFLTLIELLRLHKLLTARARGRIFLGSYWSYDQAIQLGWAWATALIARREVVAEAGLLNEDFFMYGEDLEWCLRVSRRGWQIWYCPDADVVHHGGQSAAVRWAEKSHMKVKLDATYRAVEIHKGRSYTRILQASFLMALAVEWLIARITGRPTLATPFLFNYYRHALNLTVPE